MQNNSFQTIVAGLEAEVAQLKADNERLNRLYAAGEAERHKQVDRLKLINDVARQMSSLDIDEMLSALLNRVCSAISAEYGYALLIDPAHTQATFVAAVGPNAQTLKGHDLPLIGSVMGTVIKQGQTLLINNTSSLPQFFVEIDSYVGCITRSLVVVPLKSKRETMGALIVTNKLEEAHFTEDNLSLLFSLSQLASGPVENARLFQQLQRYSQDLEEAVAARTVYLTAINETSRAISSIVAMDELFDKVSRFISALFNQARVSLCLRTGNYLTFQTTYDGEFGPEVVPANYRLKINPQHILGRCVLTGEAEVIEQTSTADLYLLSQGDSDDSTALAVPLSIGGKTIGLITVQSHSWIASRKQDLETLQSLASQVAVAMENSRLLQKSRDMATVQERTRLARDMHDGIAQNLAYLLLRVDKCLLMAENIHPRLENELENISQVITRNIEELRRHIFDLRPVGLEGQSIFKVIKAMSREFAEQMGVRINCEIIGEEIDLPHDVESSLYRVFQEALSNIWWHAQCKQIEITLQTHPDRVIDLVIKDDGVGFTPAQTPKSSSLRHGLGLVSMQERIRGLGGTFTIESAPGEGTVIRVNVPGW